MGSDCDGESERVENSEGMSLNDNKMDNDDMQAETDESSDVDVFDLFTCVTEPAVSAANCRKRKRTVAMEPQNSNFDPRLNVVYRIDVNLANGRWDELRSYKEFICKLSVKGKETAC